MACHSTQSRSSSLDIVTYRYKGQLVYVPVSSNYIQALSHARDAFPPLKKHHDASLSLSLTAPTSNRNSGGGQRPVGISAAAWPKLIAHMSRYQVIDVHVVPESNPAQTQTKPRIPDITITYADANAEDCQETRDAETESVPPPAYPATEQNASMSIEDEKAAYHRESVPTIPTRPRTPSTTSLRSKRSWFFQKLH